MPHPIRSIWNNVRTAGLMFVLSGIILFTIHVFLYLTQGTIYFLPLIVPLETILRVVPSGDALIEWLLFPKSFEGINKIVFAVLNHLPIWIFVLITGIILWVAGWLKTRRS